MNIQNAFKTYRKSRSLNQKELGLKLGIDSDAAQSRISHYESGRREIPIDLAYKFIDLARNEGDSYNLEDIYPRHDAESAA